MQGNISSSKTAKGGGEQTKQARRRRGLWLLLPGCRSALTDFSCVHHHVAVPVQLTRQSRAAQSECPVSICASTRTRTPPCPNLLWRLANSWRGADGNPRYRAEPGACVAERVRSIHRVRPTCPADAFANKTRRAKVSSAACPRLLPTQLLFACRCATGTELANDDCCLQTRNHRRTETKVRGCDPLRRQQRGQVAEQRSDEVSE